MKDKSSYHITLTPEPEGGYTVAVPALPGCISYGRTIAEARIMAKDAIRAYLASVRKRRDRAPSSASDETLFASVSV